MQVRNAFLPQYLGQYSGPWHLAQAIAGSQYATTDIDAADIVYVYDYCYYTWWLAFVHSNGRVQRDDATPGDHLLKGYQVCSADTYTISTQAIRVHDGHESCAFCCLFECPSSISPHDSARQAHSVQWQVLVQVSP